VLERYVCVNLGRQLDLALTLQGEWIEDHFDAAPGRNDEVAPVAEENFIVRESEL